MIRAQQLEFAVVIILVALALFHLIFSHTVLFQVNQRLPTNEKIRHGYLETALRGQVAVKYRSVFPNGRAPAVAEKVRIVFWLTAFVWLVIRVWELWAH